MSASPSTARDDAPTSRQVAPLVACDGVARTYGRDTRAVVAVHGVNAVVPPGARVALTGASGSGKSTLLHLMAGLEEPTAGRISWPGLDGSPLGRPGVVGMVFQGPSLLPALDVIENVALPLLLAGAGDVATIDAARYALRRLHIADLAAKLPEEISGGQAQRVAVARVLASRPRLILADEPTGQLDHTAAEHLISVLLEAAGELGAALVVATHDPRIGARLDQRWWMRDGELVVEPDQANGSS